MQERWYELDRQWEMIASNLMQRDESTAAVKVKPAVGQEEDKPLPPFKPYNVKDDPLLKEAIERIRIGFMRLFYERMEIMANKEGGAIDRDTATKQTAQIDYVISAFANKARNRLLASNYGFTTQERDALAEKKFQSIPEKGPLEIDQADHIMGNLISSAISAFTTVHREITGDEILGWVRKESIRSPSRQWSQKIPEPAGRSYAELFSGEKKPSHFLRT